MNEKILTINPGSTSTKISVFKGKSCTFSFNVQHSADDLKQYTEVNSQLFFRKQIILDTMEQAGLDMSDMDAIVGRGGGIYSLESGTYEINELIVEHARNAVSGIQHPSNLGVQLAYEFCQEYNARGFTVNPVSVDEYQDLARLTGIKGIYRQPTTHALNIKETAIRHAEELGKPYENCNLIVCHIGGGLSLAAHQNGKMIDAFNGVDGEGPLSATRCGSIVVKDLMDYMENGNVSFRTIRELCAKNGGFVDLLETSDAIEIEERIKNGDSFAELVWNTMIYQLEKSIGSMASVLYGKVDGILLTGGMAHSNNLVTQITDACSWIAPITAYPGEFEMEALAAGALRVLSGEEIAKTYSGVPIISDFLDKYSDKLK